MIRKEKKNPFFSLRMYHRVFLIFFIICILITIFSFQYYSRLSSTIREESEAYLQEISRRIGENVDRIVNDNYDVLHTMAASLEYADISRMDEAKKMLQKQKEGLSYESIFLIDTDGTAYDLSNTQTFLTLDKSVRKDLLSGKDSMSTTQIIQNKEYILFSVPLDNMSIDGKNIVALAVSYAPSSFDQVLSMSSFNDQAYSQIVTMKGAVVVRSSSTYAFKSGYNIFSTLEGLIIGEKELDDVMQEMSVNASGQIRFKLDGQETYMVYTPVAPDDWYLLSFVPVEVVNEKSNLLLQSTLIICGLITITFAGLAAALVYIFNNHKRKLEQIAYVDDITGGHTIQRFYELAEELLTSDHNMQYALVYTNIVKFKVLNDEIGRINCDAILRFFSKFMNKKIGKRVYGKAVSR